MRSSRTAAVIALTGLVAIGLAACSSGSGSSGSASAGSPATSAPAASAGSTVADPNQPSAEIVALCEQTVTDKMPQADAEALAASKGYTTRIGSVDGEPNPLTMDYRLDRMTFDVEGGVVTNCIVG